MMPMFHSQPPLSDWAILICCFDHDYPISQECARVAADERAEVLYNLVVRGGGAIFAGVQ